MKNNPYKILSSKLIYKNQWIEVKEDNVIRPDGQRGIFGTVDIGDGITVVAINSDKQTYLIKEYYYALGEYGVQTPSGGMEMGEDPITAAKKELLEEAGITAKRWIPLGFINALTTVIRSPQHLFLALDIEEKTKSEDEISVTKIPFDKAYKMVLNNEITYAPSCIAILKAKIFLEENNI